MVCRDTNVYQNKWARPAGTADTRGLARKLAGARRGKIQGGL